jgi:hypothetical protein
MLRRPREPAFSKHDSPTAGSGLFILRGSLRALLGMTGI